MARRKPNPLKQGLKAARNINVVDNPATDALDTSVEEPIDVSSEQIVDSPPKMIVDTSIAEKIPPSASRKSQSKNVVRRGRGRPPGKKSDPKTTQAGGYVDEDLYLDVQITLTQLKRRFNKRSEVNVSTLMGALFTYFQSLSADEQESFLREYSEIDNED